MKQEVLWLVIRCLKFFSLLLLAKLWELSTLVIDIRICFHNAPLAQQDFFFCNKILLTYFSKQFFDTTNALCFVNNRFPYLHKHVVYYLNYLPQHCPTTQSWCMFFLTLEFSSILKLLGSLCLPGTNVNTSFLNRTVPPRFFHSRIVYL